MKKYRVLVVVAILCALLFCLCACSGSKGLYLRLPEKENTESLNAHTPETVATQQPAASSETETVPQSIPADPTAYRPIIENAIVEMEQVGYGNGKGMLYDLDGDKTEELIMLYYAKMDAGYGMFPYAVCSVYKLDESQAVALIEKYPIFPLAGGPSGFVGVVELDGETFFAIHSESGESDIECYYGNGEWRLYTYNGNELIEKHSVNYVHALKFAEGRSETIYEQSSAVFDGSSISYEKLESWENRIMPIKTLQSFASEGEEALTLSALLESLSMAE